GVLDGNGDSWSIGVVGSIPIGNRSARGSYRRAKLFVRQQEQRLKQARQQVMLAARMAVRRLVTNESLIESNKQARILQEANVAAEEKRLQLGVTTSQQVLEIQEDLTTAQTQEIQSMIDFEKSLIDLQVSEGMLLENQGIIFEPTGDDDPLGFFHSINPVRSFR
ncbi:MAG: TolC family protein, partial [Candidatus Hydrogenedentes bacterium]|nr:TolC family protein [Candidatus Hydrogenedentota bacterium]